MKNTTQISREALSSIYSNVCEGWQTKINNLLNEQKFSIEIEVPNSLISEAYSSADKKVQKDWLAKHLPKSKSIIDEMNSYEDACRITGTKERTLKEFEEFYGKEKGQFYYSYHRISVGIEAINEGWKADWSDDNQRKYIVWKYNENNGSGFYVDFLCGSSGSGGDLYIENYDKCKKIHDVFEKDFRIYYF